MAKDYYKILGVEPTATDEQIKSAYRKASLKYHPDRHVNDTKEEQERCESKFKDIAEAYGVLSDPDKRKKYDTFGDPDAQTGGFNPFAGFGGFKSQESQKERGKDLRISLTLTIDEIYSGLHKKIKLKKDIQCKYCHGSGSEDNAVETCSYCRGTGMITEVKQTAMGYMQTTTMCPHCNGTGSVIKNPCSHCHGTGVESSQEEIEFDIPAGIFNESYFTVRGKGNAGPHRGVNGDLIVFIREAPNGKGLTRDDNNNVYCTVKAKYTDMIFGNTIQVPYIIGYKDVDIDPGMQSGETITLYGLGLKDPNGSSYIGDFIIKVECDIPKLDTLSKEQKELLKKIK